MTGANPLVGATAPTSTAAASTSNAAKAKSPNDLGPNAFITLLTAQLQAQNPLNPMDPNQMVSELTSMNTLQEIIQIRQDMDSLVTPTQSSPASGTGTPPSAGSAALAPAAGPSAGAGAPAANAISAGLRTLTNSLAPGSVAGLYSQSNSQSHLF
jgi:flagellar basal-body rod modification protein FlgD